MSRSGNRSINRFLMAAALTTMFAFAINSAIAVGSTGQNDLRRDLIKKAEPKYYSLRSEGLKEFECSANLNWDKLFKDINTKETFPGEPNLATLKTLKFVVKEDSNGAFTLTKPEPPKNGDKETEDGVRMALDGAEQKIQGFLTAWNPFVFATLFPDPERIYKIDQNPNGYHLFSKDSGLQTELVLDMDLNLIRISVTSDSFVGRTDPTFTKTSKGLLVSRLDSDLNGGEIKSTITIDYQQIQDLNLPKSVLFDAVVQGNKQSFEIDFSDCQVHK